MSKHTPGPWLIRTEGTMSGRGPEIFVAGEYYDDGSEFVVADCHSNETSRNGKRWKRADNADEIDANARLIAAAPDLLDVVHGLVLKFKLAGIKPLLNSMNPAEDLLAKAQLVIAKAEGA